MKYFALMCLCAASAIIGACIGEFREEHRRPPCNHDSHLSATNDGRNVLRP